MKLSVPIIGQGGVSRAAAPARGASAPVRAEWTPTGEEDRLEVSREAVRWVEALSDKKLREQERAQALRERLARRADIRDQLDDANETAEAMGESFQVMSRCMKIAANIMSGKKVPAKDVQYLMEHDSKLFQMAMAMRRSPKDEECDRVVKEEDEEAGASGADAGTGAAPAPAASLGGEAPAAPADGGAAAE